MRLRKLRAALSLSQRDLACEFNVAPGAISFWESGRRTIPGAILKLIEIYENELGLPADPPSAPRSLESIRSSWLSRNLKVAALAPKLAAQLVRPSLPGDKERALAETLAGSLGELKGLCAKAGQMLGYVNIGLGADAMAQFVSLEDRGPALSFEQIDKVLVEEFGKGARDLFAEFGAAPVATGSIGQVHWARLREGAEVAVKIQYPNIRKIIEIDLGNAKALGLVAIFFPGEKNKREILAEFRDRFLGECDYRIEADNQEFVRSAFAAQSDILVPKVYRELSSARVLTSEFVRGQSFREFVASSSQAERDRAGRTIFRAALQSIFEFGRLNADPHPGNYLFKDGKVVLIDFGCSKEFSPSFLADWKEHLRAIQSDDRAAADRLVEKIGYLGRKRGFDFDYHHAMTRILYRPWLQEGPFRFTDQYVLETWNAVIRENPNLPRLHLPKDWVFVNRLQWGLFSVLSLLRAEADWREIFFPILDRKHSAV